MEDLALLTSRGPKPAVVMDPMDKKPQKKPQKKAPQNSPSPGQKKQASTKNPRSITAKLPVVSADSSPPFPRSRGERALIVPSSYRVCDYLQDATLMPLLELSLKPR